MHRSWLISGMVAAAAIFLSQRGYGVEQANARVAGGETRLADAGDAKSAAGRPSDQAAIELADLNGKRHRPLEVGKDKATVLVFVLSDCPISNRYAPEIQRLAGEFAAKRIAFYLVHVDPKLSLADAKKHAQDFGYKLPVLIDRKHELVRRLKATTAPEAFVVGAGAKVIYRGRIDDRYAAIGKPRNQVQRQDLRLALAAIVDGKPVEVAQTKAIGCYIPELETENE